MTAYMGIDPSLTGTGIAIIRDDEHEAWTLVPGQLRGVERLAWLRREVQRRIEEHHPHLVALEGYAYGRSAAAHQIGEWGGVLRLSLADWGVETVDVAPAALKKYASGRGNVGKPQLAVAIYRRWGVEFPDDNQADAYVLARIAQALHEGGELTAFQAEVVEAIE